MKKIHNQLSSHPRYRLQNTSFLTHLANLHWHFDGRDILLLPTKAQHVLDACLSQGFEIDLNRSTGSDNFSQQERSLATCMAQQQQRQQQVEQENQKKRAQYESQKDLQKAWETYEDSQQSIPKAQQTLTKKQEDFNHAMLAKDTIVSALLKKIQHDQSNVQQKKNAQQSLEDDQNSPLNLQLKSFAQKHYNYQKQLQQHQTDQQRYQQQLANDTNLKAQEDNLKRACKPRTAPKTPNQPSLPISLILHFGSRSPQVIVDAYEQQQGTYRQTKKDLAQAIAQLDKTIADHTRLAQQVQALRPLTGLANQNNQQPIVFIDAQDGAQTVLKAHQAYQQAKNDLQQKTEHKRPTQPRPQGPIQEPNYKSTPQCTINITQLFATSSRSAWKKALQQERDRSQQVQTFTFAQKRGYAWRIIGIIALQAALFATTYVGWQALRSWAIMSLFNPAPALTGLACGAVLLGGLSIFGCYMLAKNAAIESYLDYVSHIFDSLVKPDNREAVKANNGQVKAAKWWQCRFFWGYETHTAHYQKNHSYKATAASELAPAQNHNEIEEKSKTSSSYIANTGCTTALPIR